MSSKHEILNWDDDKTRVCSEIASRYSKLKIILKTKNEKHLLQRWVNYHSQIVGLENLIILDNMSDNSEVLNFYASQAGVPIIARYSGFHNYVHVVEMFPELYQALSTSCDHFVFIDSDEFLTSVGDSGTTDPTRIVNEVAECSRGDAYPGVWLYNLPRSESLFHCASVQQLEDGLRWGKPILRSKSELSGVLLHNDQLPRSFIHKSQARRIYILHLTSLFPEQRINVNLHKLAARGFIERSDDLEAALNSAPEKSPDGNVKIWVDEIRQLLADCSKGVSGLCPGSIGVEPGKAVEFYSSHEKDVFEKFRFAQGYMDTL